MEQLLPLIIQLVVGAIGGNIGGAALKEKSLGTLGNSIAGAIGGVGGANILGALLGAGQAAASNGLDLNNIAGGGVGGIILTVVAALIKNAMANKG
ncbi:MAG: hypothetical protein LCH46_10395 [Proteobacteria bacterium]|nr:hypothetical protein [Pseudomonadota bacterium]